MTPRARPSRRAARLRRHAPRLALVAVVVLLVALDRAGWLGGPPPDDVAVYDGVTAAVVAVIDGDTLEIGMPDARAGRPATRVRLWGVDCPERPGPEGGGEPGAGEATDLARRLAEGRLVTLRVEPHRTRGRYGRLLAHAVLDHGRTLNEALLDAGLARADERWPHERLRPYASAERRARDARRGIWSDG